ncbi:MAG: hypothetical protein V3T58_01420 [Candidatus Hydrothermarchaeales archaeon]
MEGEIFCKVCGTKIAPEACVLVYKREVKGEEHYFCCPHCVESSKKE